MLPFSYDEDKLVLLPVNPNTLFAFWDYSTKTWDRIAGDSSKSPILVLSCDANERHFGVEPHTKSYYFKGLRSNNKYELSIVYHKNGERVTLMSARPITTPADRPSSNKHFETVKFSFVEPPKTIGKVNLQWEPPVEHFEERVNGASDQASSGQQDLSKNLSSDSSSGTLGSSEMSGGKEQKNV